MKEVAEERNAGADVAATGEEGTAEVETVDKVAVAAILTSCQERKACPPYRKAKRELP